MSLVLTRIQNIRANSNLDKYEYRPSRYGALDAFIQQSSDPTGILTPELVDKARTSIGNVLETPVIDYDGGITISDTRTLTIDDSENTSKMVEIKFATYAFGFTIAPAMYMNNEIGIQKDFETKLRLLKTHFCMIRQEMLLMQNGLSVKMYSATLSQSWLLMISLVSCIL